MLIISDRASNVNRIVRIVERMDESGDEPIEVIALHTRARPMWCASSIL